MFEPDVLEGAQCEVGDLIASPSMLFMLDGPASLSDQHLYLGLDGCEFLSKYLSPTALSLYGPVGQGEGI